jgi:3',5'-cyclic AMP phosphodiesterase CpdA
MIVLAVMAAVLLVGAAGPASAPEASHTGPHFWFVQITDTHLGDRDNTARTAQAVTAINRLPMPIAFVAHTGDIMMDNLTDAEALQDADVLNSLAAPLYSVPGNHDVVPGQLAAFVEAYQRRFGPLARAVEISGVVLLFVCTEPLAQAQPIAGYDPLAWLEEQLAAAGDRPVILFTHTPPMEDFYDNRMHPGWPDEARVRWRQLIDRPNVRAVIAGHFHRDELHWTGNVPTYVAAPIAGYFGRQISFRLYEYRDGRLSYRTVYLN